MMLSFHFTLDNNIYDSGPAVIYQVNTFMRYQLLNDDIGKFLIVDTWYAQILAKVSTMALAARICQNLNKRLGTDNNLQEHLQKHLTNEN